MAFLYGGVHERPGRLIDANVDAKLNLHQLIDVFLVNW